MARRPTAGGGGYPLVIDFHAAGGAELIAAFKALGTTAEVKRAAEAALRPAATLIARAARQKAPRRTGALRKAIKVSNKASFGRGGYKRLAGARNQGVVEFFVGIDGSVKSATEPKNAKYIRGGKRGQVSGKPRRGKKLPNNISTIAGVTEYGTPHQAAVPFMRGAYNEQKGAAKALIAKSIWPAIEKTAQRAVKRRARRAARLAG